MTMISNKGRTDAGVFPWTPELRERARALQAEGRTYNQIGEEISNIVGRRCWGYHVRAVLQDTITKEARRARLKARRLQAMERGEDLPEIRDPIYDPHRDPAPVWADHCAFLLGDPPVGRRAIDVRQAVPA
jgi:hypothetical protein